MLKKFRQLMNKDEKGFTLVELLAVIVILGIIAAIAIPSIANVVENSKKDSLIRTAEQAVEAYRLAETSSDLDTIQTESSGAALTFSELAAGGYLENSDGYSGSVVPSEVLGDNDSATGESTYQVSVTGNGYEIVNKNIDSITRDDVNEEGTAAANASDE
ncbi:hypothetical protein N780_02830 [Pontibacillus chungwhensis BH030062]|uniref:Uncharacterized protein n=1 Tax=Pontibacillus chungwhensis BH030062 TaxID=1385513 RepID=A0A0A2VB86_9BACI|nr:prepilin-type N-terminal cleavage/methylation domain-containing protein [Pontibacillus chungwhensis]KGP90925.1 hypothetical protein N780_02830 [Pontibacillus chungwhensis BH030062]